MSFSILQNVNWWLLLLLWCVVPVWNTFYFANRYCQQFLLMIILKCFFPYTDLLITVDILFILTRSRFAHYTLFPFYSPFEVYMREKIILKTLNTSLIFYFNDLLLSPIPGGPLTWRFLLLLLLILLLLLLSLLLVQSLMKMGPLIAEILLLWLCFLFFVINVVAVIFFLFLLFKLDNHVN